MTKFDFYIKKINEICFGKSKLNVTDLCKVMDKSRSWVDMQIKQNNLHLLPPFKKEQGKGNYTKYEFDAFSVAEFLSKD